MAKRPSVRPPAPTRPETLRLLPVGGLGSIGMNAMLIGYGDDWVLLDCGVMFPDAGEPGMELVLPSIDLLEGFRDRLRAIVITHGHEDHIGAVPYVVERFPVPIHATRFTCGLLRHKLAERGLTDKVELSTVAPGDQLKIGPFEFNFLRVTHSIPDCVSLVIRTPIGNVLFTGDFKIEAGLRDGAVFDEAGFRALGKEGVLLMMSDSTNAEVPGWSRAESVVQIALKERVAECKGRIIVGLFSSNLYRVHSVVEAARAAGRYVAMLGLSMHRYTRVADECTDMPFDRNDFIDIEDIDLYDDDEIVIIATGSQGESRAALSRMARGIHPHVTVREGDTLILSSRMIPGNERVIHRMMGAFSRSGVDVIHQAAHREIHGSGHAYQEELEALLSWVQPRFFVPVHGEPSFLRRHASLARKHGVEQTLVIENGQIAEVDVNGVRVVDEVDCTPWYVDGTLVGDARRFDLKGRVEMAWNGTIGVSALVWPGTKGRFDGSCQVRARGLFTDDGASVTELEKLAVERLRSFATTVPLDEIERQLAAECRRFFRRSTGHRPIVLAMVHAGSAGGDQKRG